MATATEQFEVRNRWTNAVQFIAGIVCNPDASIGVKIGLAVKWARKSGAVLSGADLRDADWIPKIPDIHKAIYAAASAPRALDMGSWHKNGYCGTTHCRAGWAVVLAGDGGRVLEGVYGTGTAAALIYQASDPTLERIPNWIAGDAEALADMKRLADGEVSK